MADTKENDVSAKPDEVPFIDNHALQLIKALVPAALIPTLTINEKTAAAAVRIPPGHYMLFVAPDAVDIEALTDSPCPFGVEMDIVAVHLRSGENIQDKIALYKVGEADD